ncbi:DUF2130 domain-containing protein [Actinopolymorpha sp. B17G11]|uniref:DUF2130 domain-containing protein n=1 Tax=Actinopolymorpha sp. B17G11 TaxID=3160861 RepID=UPI0032E5012F
MAEKDKQLQRLSASLEEAQRRAVQGSEELQGTAQEDALEQDLASEFPTDELAQIPRGTRGADVLQTIRDRSLRCGAILWSPSGPRSGTTPGWPCRCGASAAVILTACLPPGAARIDRRDDVWITDLASAPLLALVLREGLVALAQQQARIAGKTDLQGEVYDYITSARFSEHVKAAVESMTNMHDQLDAERAAHERLWSKRAKEIGRAEAHIARMMGDIEGLGASISSIPSRLQLAPRA